MRSWPDTRRLTLVAATTGLVALGALAERERYAWSETHDWVPDLVVGWALGGLGIATLALGRPLGAGLLLTGSGLAWFTGNFFATEPSWVASTAGHLSWVFLAPLVHLSLAYPSGRPRTLGAAAGIVGIWAATLAPWLDWNDERTRVAVLTSAAALGVVLWLRSSGHARRSAVWGLVSLGGLLVTVLASTQLGPTGSWNLDALALGGGLVLVGVWLFVGLPSYGELARRAIELDEATGTLEGALASLLEDPGLRVGYRGAEGLFADDDGRDVPVSVPGHVTTAIGDQHDPVALVVHHPLVLTGDDEHRAVSVAVTLAAERARLREEVRLQADEIARSTVRLIRAEDDARAKVAVRIASGPGDALAASALLVDKARLAAEPDVQLDLAIVRAADQLAQAAVALAGFAGGLGVPALEAGLRSAIADMIDGLPLEAEVRVDDVDCAQSVATTIWFVCAEGIANVLKHADASRLAVEVAETASGIRVVIEDDGRGGADARGSGLVGLRDRIAAHGGRLVVSSPTGEGTALVAELSRSDNP